MRDISSGLHGPKARINEPPMWEPVYFETNSISAQSHTTEFSHGLCADIKKDVDFTWDFSADSEPGGACYLTVSTGCR